MINKDNFKALLKHLGFEEKDSVFSKNFESGSFLSADFKKEKLQYPESEGLIINERQTCNFSSAENAVVFECVCKLLEKGYKPKHIELEPKWKVGHGPSGGRADILVKNQNNKPLLIIECKTYGTEFDKAWKDTLSDGGQLFSYVQQISETEFLCLYASEFNEKEKQISIEQKIISHTDNEKTLELGDGLNSYEKASNVEKRHEVWKEIYRSEYTEVGIFEKGILPYQIGKNNYTLNDDTRPITEKDKEGKYHRFRTILRQHNIARKETAFEVLVNLFLAKIVDEEENKTNLEFYWKGFACDNYYDFIDRLQKLYQIGMRKFLKDEVMYISNEQIDGAFWAVKNKRNATKKQIQKYFRDLKFFSNNAFSLINVHNERLFRRNAEVLVELVQMWQGLRLKTEAQNQFLGDMFEYFLDNSIKQSEGQFFTPIPITKFIVSSLPLKDKIKRSSEPLKAIDFACGSGHFLTEYAHQIKPLVAQYKQAEISDYYENTIGIEKEDRLAKIAKVSAYMYGQDQIKIIEKDALNDIDEVKPASFDVLVANPPFAVEGFLLNLDEKQKENYELIKTTEINSNTNNIQCFFIERAKQLMAGNGVVGVIVPSSVLSNSDSTHIGTREIILKYFDMVALVELGSGTFGKTGTNTVVLFLRRKDKRPEPAEHYQNRVDDYFEEPMEDNPNIEQYQDLGLIKKYCEHIKIPFEEYQHLFGITSETISDIDKLLKTELFAEYKKAFDTSAEIKNMKNKNAFKNKSEQGKALELNQRLINYLHKIEKDKLYYFMLALDSPHKVLIVQSPNDNKKQKAFLGYEWSSAKGNEGIKYNGGSTVNDIITPLFNPNNINDSKKISYLIQQNFLGKGLNDLTEFGEYRELISYADVADILDFSRTDFNKAFSLSPKKNITIATKWDLVRLENILLPIKGNATKISKSDILKEGKYPVITQEAEKLISGYTNNEDKIDDLPVIVFGDHSCTFKYVDFYFFRGADGTQLLKPNSEFLTKYLFYVLQIIDITNKSKYERHFKYLNNAYIPFPPKDIQEKIVSECEAVDQATEQAQQTIDKAKKEIVDKIKECFDSSYRMQTISEVSIKIFAGGDKPKIFSDARTNECFVPVLSNGSINNGLLGYTNLSDDRVQIPSITISARGTLGFTVARNERYLPIVRLIVINPRVSIIDHFYLAQILQNTTLVNTGATIPQLTIPNLRTIQIPVPPLSEQQKLVASIDKLDQKIKQAQITIETAPRQKQQILDKYLNE